jgi:ABC-type antimicrobial peptide transport system permease subunit
MYIWYLVVFVAMGFGIVNTTLMAVYERMREFGLLKALGMKPWWILREVLTESFLLLITGMIIGNGLGLVSIFVLSRSGIDLSALAAGAEYAGMTRIIYPAIDLKDVTVANLVVLVLGLCVSAYPAVKAARFTPVEALTHT